MRTQGGEQAMQMLEEDERTKLSLGRAGET